MTVSTWYHHRNPPRGKRRPRVYEVEVLYEREQLDLEQAARRLGHDDMSAFFLQAAHVWLWLLSEAAFRQEKAEAERELAEMRERADKADRERREREREGKA